MKYAFCGDRQIAVDVLSLLHGKGYKPDFLFVSEHRRQSHAKQLIKLSQLPSDRIFCGKEISSCEVQKLLEKNGLDYIISIHYPYIFPEKTISIPIIGVINLHPAYLPFNKGWHTPSWAILENDKYGATLHFMTKELDGGNIINQRELTFSKGDTANTLYQKVLALEYEVFESALPSLISLKPTSHEQKEEGSSHKKRDIKAIQELHLDNDYKLSSLFDKMRALTTNNINESCFFIHENKKYHIQLIIKERSL